MLSDILRIEKADITDNLDIRDSRNWDSLKHMQFVFAVESAYCIELEPDEIMKMVKISDIKAIISKRQ